jgi:hypothetical protein
MRAYARVALVSMGVPASLGLAGCAAIEELRDAFLRWVESEKPPSGPSMIADDLPAATPVVPPEKTPKEPSKRRPQPKDTARKLPQPQIGVLPPEKPPIPDSTEATRPEGTEGQSVPFPPTPPQLPSRWPPAPPPGRFSR